MVISGFAEVARIAYYSAWMVSKYLALSSRKAGLCYFVNSPPIFPWFGSTIVPSVNLVFVPYSAIILKLFILFVKLLSFYIF